MNQSDLHWTFLFFLAVLLPVHSTWISTSTVDQFEPHIPLGTDWFEGWYTRVISADRQWSLGIIFGSYPLRTSSTSVVNTHVSLLLKGPKWDRMVVLGEDRLHSLVVEFDQCRLSSPQKEKALRVQSHEGTPPQSYSIWRRPCFSIKSQPMLGQNDSVPQIHAVMSPEVQVLNVTWPLPDGDVFKLVMKLTKRVSWDASDQGPEGLGIYRLLNTVLPLHWYVFSTASQAEVQASFGDIELSTHGLGHMEKNWGSGFPDHWIWVQSVTQKYRLVIAGGDLGFRLTRFPSLEKWLKRDSLLLSWSSPSSTLTWTPVDSLLRPIHVTIVDAERGLLSVSGEKGNYKIEVVVKAPVETFATVKCPTRRGFLPYSIESYSANATVHVWKKSFTQQEDSFELMETVVLSETALEFGGSWWKRSLST